MKTVNDQFNAIMNSSIFRLDGSDIDLNDSLKNLCSLISIEDETDWNIGEGLECSLDSLIVGAFWAYTECHEGQYSETYETLCALGKIFTPNYSDGPEDDSGEFIAYELIEAYLLK